MSEKACGVYANVKYGAYFPFEFVNILFYKVSQKVFFFFGSYKEKGDVY